MDNFLCGKLMSNNNIRKYINILLENQTKIKQKTGLDMPFAEPPTSKGELTKSEPTSVSDLPGKKSSKSKSKTTQYKTPSGSTDVMRQFIDRVGDVDDEVEIDSPTDDSDFDQTTIEPVEPENLPTVISKAVARTDQDLDVNWHKLSNLPGYAIKQIRGAFRPLFRSIMNVELEDVSVATTLDPSTNALDMKKLIGAIGKSGIRDDNFSLKAFDIDPENYQIENAYVYNMGGWAFLILKENLMGTTNFYVYAGPGRGTDLDNSGSPKELK